MSSSTAEPRTPRDSANHAARWAFRKLDTLRHVILRAGPAQFTRPEGKLTLTMNGNATARDDVLRYVRLRALRNYATLEYARLAVDL